MYREKMFCRSKELQSSCKGFFGDLFGRKSAGRQSPKCLREYSFIEQDTAKRFKQAQILLLIVAAALLFFGG